MTSSNIVKLNVGGTVFQTSKSTLTKYDCMFRAMLESEIPLQIDESGSIFIDRDPTHFRYILNFLRDGKVELPENQKEIKEILAEAEFYSFQELIDFCESHESQTPKRDYRVVRKNAELKEILIDATRGVCVIFYPHRKFGHGCNHSRIKQLAQKHKDKLDIVLIESPYEEDNSWSYKYFPLDQPYKPTYVRTEASRYYEIIARIDQHLSSL